ncbi:restriction endonuclease subunit S [Mesorhizobium sp. M0965]|uniref:restriction endonuclease subunit S n=1 Tax=Mesorhizobium sp. M0965 TaxID=2957036 RepID=UPI00333928D3
MNTTEPRLGDYFISRRERGKQGLPTLSVTLDRGLVRRDSLERRTDTTLTEEEHLRVYPGDIAYNMMRMWQGASGLAHEEALVSPAYIVLSPKKNVDPNFASYLFKLPEMIHRFWAYSYGLTDDRLRLYFNDFKRIPRALPPVVEQKKIVEILSTWDAAIETTEKLLANAEAQKRALMQQLLTGRRRLKGFESRAWKVAKLASFGEIISGYPFESEMFCEDGALLVRGSNVKRGALDWADGITERWPSIEGFERYLLSPNDIVIAMDGYVGKSHAFISSSPRPSMLLVHALRAFGPYLTWIPGTFMQIFAARPSFATVRG